MAVSGPVRNRFAQLAKQIGKDALGPCGTTVVHDEISLDAQHALGQKPRRTPDEQEFIVTMQNTWEKAREEGRDEGRLEEARTALRSVLAQRELVTSREEKARIDACADAATLRRWLNQAVVAQSAAEALGVNGAEAGRASPRRRRSRISP